MNTNNQYLYKKYIEEIILDQQNIYIDKILKKHEKVLIIRPIQGLTKRFRFIASCYILAKLLQMKLLIYWRKTDLCGIDIEDLFDLEKKNLIFINEETFNNYNKDDDYLIINKSLLNNNNNNLREIQLQLFQYKGLIIKSNEFILSKKKRHKFSGFL